MPRVCWAIEGHNWEEIIGSYIVNFHNSLLLYTRIHGIIVIIASTDKAISI